MSMISPSVIRELKSVDWNFPQSSNEPFRSPHWYPGTFPPELPSTLIQATTRPGDVVSDPYGGIGTTSTEAIRLGRKAWLVELNRVGALTAYVSGTLLLLRRWHPECLTRLLTGLAGCIARSQEGNLFSGASTLDNAEEIDREVSRLVVPSPAEFLSQVLFDPSPSLELLEPWYHEKTLSQICKFREGLKGEGSAVMELLGLMALSACLKALSSQTRSWGHIADNVLPKTLIDKDAELGLRRWYSRFARNLNNAQMSPHSDRSGRVQREFFVSIHDWSATRRIKKLPKKTVQLLITSPPYGGAIDYILSQRLSYYLLGGEEHDLRSEQRKEIGARRRRFSDTSRTDWADALCDALGKQIKSVHPEGTIIVVMPHKSTGRSNGNEIVDATLRNANWTKLIAVDRSIRAQRTRQAWTSIKRETINIYRRTDGSEAQEA